VENLIKKPHMLIILVSIFLLVALVSFLAAQIKNKPYVDEKKLQGLDKKLSTEEIFESRISLNHMRVSRIELVTVPERYHERRIQVVAEYLALIDGEYMFFMSEEDRENKAFGKAILLVTGGRERIKKALDEYISGKGKLLIIAGTFDAEKTIENSEKYAGAIVNITRAD